jgi:hypothetical protein
MMAVATQHCMLGYDETSRWDRNWQFTHPTWQYVHADCAKLEESWQVFLGAGGWLGLAGAGFARGVEGLRGGW